MTIQKVSYQPAFGHRIVTAGAPAEVAQFFSKIKGAKEVENGMALMVKEPPTGLIGKSVKAYIVSGQHDILALEEELAKKGVAVPSSGESFRELEAPKGTIESITRMTAQKVEALLDKKGRFDFATFRFDPIK